MKRNPLLIIIMILAMLLAGGCGNKGTEIKVDTHTESNLMESKKGSYLNSETGTVESSVEVKQEEVSIEPETIDVNSLITEKTNEELDLKKYQMSYEDRTMDNEGEKVFYLDLFEEEQDDSGLLTATGNIDIYNINGIRVGYAIPKARFDIFGEYDGWYYFYLDGNRRFARVEDVDDNIKTNEQIAEEASKQEESNVNIEVPVESPPVDVPPVNEPVEVPVETNTYTAEDAIADYRSIMEANGITWDPSIKEYASWGTGMLPLNKAEVEAGAYSSVESFAIGNHGGDSWTKYYMEVTGSDANYVYVTQYVE